MTQKTVLYRSILSVFACGILCTSPLAIGADAGAVTIPDNTTQSQSAPSNTVTNVVINDQASQEITISATGGNNTVNGVIGFLGNTNQGSKITLSASGDNILNGTQDSKSFIKDGNNATIYAASDSDVEGEPTVELKANNNLIHKGTQEYTLYSTTGYKVDIDATQSNTFDGGIYNYGGKLNITADNGKNTFTDKVTVAQGDSVAKISASQGNDFQGRADFGNKSAITVSTSGGDNHFHKGADLWANITIHNTGTGDNILEGGSVGLGNGVTVGITADHGNNTLSSTDSDGLEVEQEATLTLTATEGKNTIGSKLSLSGAYDDKDHSDLHMIAKKGNELNDVLFNNGHLTMESTDPSAHNVINGNVDIEYKSHLTSIGALIDFKGDVEATNKSWQNDPDKLAKVLIDLRAGATFEKKLYMDRGTLQVGGGDTTFNGVATAVHGGQITLQDSSKGIVAKGASLTAEGATINLQGGADISGTLSATKSSEESTATTPEANKGVVKIAGDTTVNTGGKISSDGEGSSITLTGPTHISGTVGATNKGSLSFSGDTTVNTGGKISSDGEGSSITLTGPTHISGTVGATNKGSLSFSGDTTVNTGGEISSDGDGSSITLTGPTHISGTVSATNKGSVALNGDNTLQDATALIAQGTGHIILSNVGGDQGNHVVGGTITVDSLGKIDFGTKKNPIGSGLTFNGVLQAHGQDKDWDKNTSISVYSTGLVALNGGDSDSPSIEADKYSSVYLRGTGGVTIAHGVTANNYATVDVDLIDNLSGKIMVDNYGSIMIRDIKEKDGKKVINGPVTLKQGSLAFVSQSGGQQLSGHLVFAQGLQIINPTNDSLGMADEMTIQGDLTIQTTHSDKDNRYNLNIANLKEVTGAMHIEGKDQQSLVNVNFGSNSDPQVTAQIDGDVRITNALILADQPINMHNTVSVNQALMVFFKKATFEKDVSISGRFNMPNGPGGNQHELIPASILLGPAEHDLKGPVTITDGGDLYAGPLPPPPRESGSNPPSPLPPKVRFHGPVQVSGPDSTMELFEDSNFAPTATISATDHGKVYIGAIGDVAKKGMVPFLNTIAAGLTDRSKDKAVQVTGTLNVASHGEGSGIIAHIAQGSGDPVAGKANVLTIVGSAQQDGSVQIQTPTHGVDIAGTLNNHAQDTQTTKGTINLTFKDSSGDSETTPPSRYMPTVGSSIDTLKGDNLTVVMPLKQPEEDKAAVRIADVQTESAAEGMLHVEVPTDKTTKKPVLTQDMSTLVMDKIGDKIKVIFTVDEKKNFPEIYVKNAKPQAGTFTSKDGVIDQESEVKYEKTTLNGADYYKVIVEKVMHTLGSSAQEFGSWMRGTYGIAATMHSFAGRHTHNGAWIDYGRDRWTAKHAFASVKNHMNYLNLGYNHAVSMAGASIQLGARAGASWGQSQFMNGNQSHNRLGLVGVYATTQLHNGTYVGAELNYERLSTRMQDNLFNAKQHKDAVQASVEIGRQYGLVHDWFIEPQAQLQAVYIFGKHYMAQRQGMAQKMRVKAKGSISVQSRLGVKVGRQIQLHHMPVSLWWNADLFHEFAGKQQVSFADNSTNMQDKPVTIRNKGTWAHMKVGTSIGLSKALSVEAALGAQVGMKTHSLTVNAGMNYQF